MWPFKSNKIKISESGLLDGFVDWHCHVLPGVDDGAATTEDSLAILSLMEEAGFSEVYLTPHVVEKFPNSTSILTEEYNKLTRRYQGGIKLHLASENRLDRLFERRLEKGDFLTADGMLLVESSFAGRQLNLKELLGRTIAEGYSPLFAHPERFCYMTQQDYRELKGMGVAFQLNLPSLIGVYGPEAMQNARWILENGWYDRIGTDTHSLQGLSLLLNAPLPLRYIPMLEGIIKRDYR